MGLLALFGCSNKAPEQIVIQEPPKEKIITCDDIQEQVNYILKEGYKVRLSKKSGVRNYFLIGVFTTEDYYKYYLDDIVIYKNESNESVYNYLGGIIEKIKSKKRWLKSQEPNPCLQEIDFKNVK